MLEVKIKLFQNFLATKIQNPCSSSLTKVPRYPRLSQYTVHCTLHCTLYYTLHFTLYSSLSFTPQYKRQSDWLIGLNPQGTLPFLPLGLFVNHYTVQYNVHYTVDCTVKRLLKCAVILNVHCIVMEGVKKKH